MAESKINLISRVSGGQSRRQGKQIEDSQAIEDHELNFLSHHVSTNTTS